MDSTGVDSKVVKDIPKRIDEILSENSPRIKLV
jgi:hypothetical protein